MIKAILEILLFFTSNKQKNAYDSKLEKKMNAFGLENWQKDLVRKGLNDPEDFDEDDTSDDDNYYNEDD